MIQFNSKCKLQLQKLIITESVIHMCIIKEIKMKNEYFNGID